MRSLSHVSVVPLDLISNRAKPKVSAELDLADTRGCALTCLTARSGDASASLPVRGSTRQSPAVVNASQYPLGSSSPSRRDLQTCQSFSLAVMRLEISPSSIGPIPPSRKQLNRVPDGTKR